MLARTKAVIAAAAVVAAPLTVAVMAAPAADAAKGYSNCDALHRDFKHGVSKSAAAARKQVRDGYGRPASGKRAQAIYARNKGPLDRDKDGTACEA